MSLPENVYLLGTGAIGDAVMMTALVRSLSRNGVRATVVSKGFTLPLFTGLVDEDGSALNFGVVPGYVEKAGELPSLNDPVKGEYGALGLCRGDCVDISTYLESMPNSSSLTVPPDDLPYAPHDGLRFHLVEHMGRKLNSELRRLGYDTVLMVPRRSDVGVCLTDEELRLGRNRVDEISSRFGHRPVVVVAPYASTENRDVTPENLEALTRVLNGFAVPVILDPIASGKYVPEGMEHVGDKSLRNSCAVLGFADAYLGVDSGPWHMAAAVRMGNQRAAQRFGLRPLSSMVGIAGSSDPRCFGYGLIDDSTSIVSASGDCPVAPCGAHGYHTESAYTDHFARKGLPEGATFEKGCIYRGDERLRCMKSLSVDEVIARIERAIRS